MMPQLPQLIRFYIRQVLTGFALAAVFVAALLWFDIAGLGRLILGADVEWVALAMLVLFNGFVFAGAQCSVSILLMAERDDDDDRGTRDGLAQPVLVPVTRD